ncbi:MAG: DUF551 domain-containing protein [Clostridia bacterium]|nr:DUF551 domain-containing protein [Clostridia bacterium]MBQ7792967.1 DUF551 domain-containing protein [Clostridia bacterium]
MDIKENLVELLDVIIQPGQKTLGDIAEYLIAHGVTVQDWISVKDRLPEEKVNCIVHYKHAYCKNDDYWAIGIASYVDEIQEFVGIDTRYYVITHWMPLPQPPKGE